MDKFHNTEFDAATQLKLALFRGYIREWLPVFLTKNFQKVNLYDLFAGPGYDAYGNPGSPVIIVEEMNQFFQTYPDLKDSANVRMVFNDYKQLKIVKLKQAVEQLARSPSCCSIEYSRQPFQKALQQYLPEIASKNSANLIIMDQFGFKEVTPEVIRQLAECSTTDILFFIPSSFIKRFIETPEVGGKFDMDSEQVKSRDYNTIHRFVCEYFRQKLGSQEYCLAPFSIKKGSNIYGVIFGSQSLFGLDKFLKVCWALDPVTGEANYNIDGDFAWAQKGLFPGMNTISKEDKFQHDLKVFVHDRSPTNHDVYKFTLTQGFRPQRATGLLRKMRQNGQLVVTDLDSKRSSTQGGYYIAWDEYNKQLPRIRFSVKETRNG